MKIPSYIPLLITLLILTIFCRINITDDSNLTYDQKTELKNDQDNYYLAQYDSYAFYQNAKNNQPTNFLEYNEIYLYKLITFFKKDADLIKVISFIPLFYMCLSCILLFYIIRIYTKDDLISFIGTMAYSLNIEIILNTYYGYVDTDPLNIFFTLATILFLLLICKRNHILIYILFTITFSLFKFTWAGYFYIMLIILLSFILHIIIKNKDYSKFKLITGAIILLFTLITVTLEYKSKILKYLAFNNTTNFTNELTIPFTLGSRIFYVIIFILFMIFYLRGKKDFKMTLLLTWFITLYIAGTRGNRHLIYFLIPTIIILSYLLKRLINWVITKKHKKINMSIFTIFICILILFSGFIVKIPTNKLVVMDDTIYDSMQEINKHTNTSKIISWWDYGIIYQTYTTNNVIFKSSQPKDHLIKKLATIHTTTNHTLAKKLIKEISKNKPTIFITNSADKNKIDTLEYISKLKIEDGSVINIGLANSKFLFCKQGEFKKICAYEVI